MDRYNDYGTFLRRLAGGRVQKIPVDAGFTCPNRDGTLGRGGCTYCNNRSFSPSYGCGRKSVTLQLEEGKRFMARKYASMKYLAYFQAYTGTYASVDFLKALYEEALCCEGVVGIVIGTRPDCMPDELLAYLAQLSRRCLLIVEYGIESTNDHTLRRVRRGHTFAVAKETIQRTADAGIMTGGHVILGLPGESRDDILAQASVVSSLPLTCLKLHQLQLIKGTEMSCEYKKTPFPLFTMEEYIECVIDYLELLRPSLVLERFVSEAPSSLVIAPKWGVKPYAFMQRVKERMEERNTWQGKRWKE